jgi:hypothetical protein
VKDDARNIRGVDFCNLGIAEQNKAVKMAWEILTQAHYLVTTGDNQNEQYLVCFYAIS